MAELGPYQLEARVGGGSQALSYRAFHRHLQRRVFLKVLPLALTTEEQRVRLLNEARALAGVDHPAVVRVYDAGQVDDMLYVASEYVEGPDLRTRILSGPLPWEEVRSLAKALLAGLEALHRAGIIHRDIKPSNIVLSPGGPKLVDLGLARLVQGPEVSQTGTLVGTPAYMDPAVLRGWPPDPRSDLFSLGATLYEALTGQRAFPGDTLPEVLRALRDHDPLQSLPPTYPAQARRFLEALLQKDPQARPASAAEAAALLSERTGLQRPRRSIVPWAMAGLMVAAAFTGVSLRLAQRSERIPPVEPGEPAPLPPSQVVSEGEPPPSVVPLPPRVTPVPETPSSAWVWVSVLPWAEVRLRGAPLDTTPLRQPLRLPAGRCSLELRHPGYPPWPLVVDLRPQARESLFVDLPESLGFVVVYSDPWAQVWVDDVPRGVTPLAEALALEPRPHGLVLENPFYPKLSLQVEPSRGDTLVVSANLRTGAWNVLTPSQARSPT